MRVTIKVLWMTRNGAPTGCPECSTGAVQFMTTQPFDGWPARGWCTVCSHNWEDVLITNALVRQIAAESTGRVKATDSDTFAVAAPGQYLEGELVPEITVDDLRVVWKKAYKPLLKRVIRQKKNKAKNAAKRAVVGTAKKTVAAPTAAVLKAAWGAQAGGWEPTDGGGIENPCPAGCDEGWFDLESHIHGSPRVVCSLCSGSGEYEP
ncbi:hypothetical protein ACGFZH_40295 [Streptomyces zaomyceticus]|uniref:hypothetical protein n=1 Tax=Streptomyces zaomyceticus TaxID=68286 RepID=UPI00372124A2